MATDAGSGVLLKIVLPVSVSLIVQTLPKALQLIPVDVLLNSLNAKL